MKKIRISILGMILSCLLICLWQGANITACAEEGQQAEFYISNVEDEGYIVLYDYYPDPSTVPEGKTGDNQTYITYGVLTYGREATLTVTNSNPSVLKFVTGEDTVTIPAGNRWKWTYLNRKCEMCSVGATTLTLTCEGVTRTVDVFVKPEGTELTEIQQTAANELTLKWEKVAGVTGYQILRCPKNETDKVEVVADVKGDSVTSTTIYAPHDVTYQYTIQTYVSLGDTVVEGADRYWLEYTSYTATKMAPELESLQVSGTAFCLKWKQIPGVLGYQIYRSTDENGNYTCIKNVDATVNTFSEKGKKGVTYYYHVKAVYQDGAGMASNSLSGFVPISGKAQSKIISKIIDSNYTGYYTANGKFYAVAVDGSKLNIYIFDSKMNYKGKKTVKLGSYDSYGGFYAGIDGNFYVAVGYNNYKEQDNKTVIKVMQYSSKWKLKKTAKITGGASNSFKGIYQPFCAGSCRMDMNGSTLYVHTARTMYVHSDGLHHQSNIPFAIDTKTMKWKATEDSYCSHSFDQYVKFKDNCLYLANHGDAYPRSMCLTMINNYGTTEESWSQVNVFELLGEIGNNYTGANIGGMEVGADNVLICGTAQPHKYKVKGVTGYWTAKTKKGTYVYLKHNVYLAVVNRETEKTKRIWLTKNNPKTTNVIIDDAKMVKLSDERFAILYQSTTGKKETLNYVVVDNTGKKICSKKYSGYSMTSDAQPILYNGYIQWVSSVYSEKKNSYVMALYRVPATY